MAKKFIIKLKVVKIAPLKRAVAVIGRRSLKAARTWMRAKTKKSIANSKRRLDKLTRDFVRAQEKLDAARYRNLMARKKVKRR